MKKAALLVLAILGFAGVTWLRIYLEGQKETRELKESRKKEADEKVSVIDPYDAYVCEGDPDKYIYFQVGNEVFKYNSKSSVQIDVKFKPSDLYPIKNSQKKGCVNNPYRWDDIFNFGIDGNAIRERLGDIKFGRFERFALWEPAPERLNLASHSQEIIEDLFFQAKKEYGMCDEPEERLIRCFVPNSNADVPRENWSAYYMAKEANYLSPNGRPFMLEYRPYAAAPYLKGSVFYRIYPTVDIGYSFYGNEFDPNHVIELDKVLRNIFEDVRVK